MKKTFLLILLFSICFQCLLAQQDEKKSQETGASVRKKMEEQIRQYFFVMLTKGTYRGQDSATSAKIQEQHLANINRLYNDGKIKVAGPFGDDGQWRGIFI